MWSRKRLDIGWTDLASGACRVLFPPERSATAGRIERLWPQPENTLACFSVRSGFDLFLGSLGLPRGSEALVSAITIRDMVRIIEHHGLVPVPVDIDPAKMAPRIEQWQRAVTPATKLILIAHLFGGHTPMEPLLALARQHGLLVAEDCAQAYAGPAYSGHPQADVSMFSFGTIKNSTALGAAVLRVRDAALLAKMRATQAQYPIQGRWTYLKRLAKCSVLKTLSCRPICGSFVKTCRLFGVEYDRWVNGAARGFPGDDLFAQIRRRPSAALLAVLERRLRTYDFARSDRHTAKGRALAARLRGALFCPGADVEPHTYWVFPVLTDEPERLMDHLAGVGFDATQGQSLCVVTPPTDRADQQATAAEELLAKAVFLPFYPELPAAVSERMAESVLALACDACCVAAVKEQCPA
jgi:perosamine synthetase